MLESFFTRFKASEVLACLFETNTISSAAVIWVLELNKVILPVADRANIMSTWWLFLECKKFAARANKFTSCRHSLFLLNVILRLI